MDKRFLLAFTLFLLVVGGWSYLRAKNHPPEPTPEINPAPATPDSKPPPTVETSAPEPAPSAAPTIARDDAIPVDTDLYRARFTNHGAALLELLSKKHFKSVGVAGHPEREADPREWLELCTDMDAARPILTLRRNPTGESRASPLDASNWECSRETVTGGTDLTFRFADGDGHRFEKIVRFRDGRHDVEVELRFASDREAAQQGTSSYLFTAAGCLPSAKTSNWQAPPSAIVTQQSSNSVVLYPASKLKSEALSVPLAREDGPPFFGVCTNYFACVEVPDAATLPLVENVSCEAVLDRPAYEREVAELSTKRGVAPPADELTKLEDLHRDNVRTTAALKIAFPARDSAPVAMKFDLYAGPKHPELIQKDDRYRPLELIYKVDYGSWPSLRWINVVMLAVMRLMHALTRNWGVAIILLTILVKLLLFPLNRLQSRTMEQFQKKMKILQPQINELKKRYKNNLQKLNVEQQKLMREHGVRPPVFGCLIVFLQMPVWYGLFQIMRSSFELRQQPFFGWINDLSAPDTAFSVLGWPVHVLPILMMACWFLQNRMMPKPADPQAAQMQKMMNFMPLIFGAMLYTYASGQSLYMLTNSLLGILQMKLLKVTPTN